MDEKREANRILWNRWTPIHERSPHYALEAFRSGGITLQPQELELLGDMRAKSLLHLQCHFGLDTLSWVRLGARVTGVDISDEAIALARRLAAEQKIEAQFIRCDVYDLPERLDEAFDVVFTSYGVLAWLSDLPQWAKIVARFLKPGGVLCLLDGHPLLAAFGGGYFNRAAERCDTDRSYAMAAGETHERTTSWEWHHTIGDILNAVVGAGLRVERFTEYAEHAYARFLLPSDAIQPPAGMPVVFGLLATKG